MNTKKADSGLTSDAARDGDSRPSLDTVDGLVGLLRRGVEIMCNPDPLGLAQEGWINEANEFIEANIN